MEASRKIIRNVRYSDEFEQFYEGLNINTSVNN
ncbi:hypothetical protein EZS27_017664 [termite gut metagenome]|uniref:Uncharacterized protein n=1 Tax=termite gut metagenome TaxID=433724 RepID=A0A5J4RK01_9ZZZZ